MKSQLIFLPVVVAVICFSSACPKTYIDRTVRVEPEGTRFSPDRKQLGDRGHSPYPGQ